MSDDLVKRLWEDYRESYEENIPYEVIETYKKERHEAAARIEQVEAELIRTHRLMMDDAKRVEQLEAALWFYADPIDWAAGYCKTDRGNIARAALEGEGL